jgi:outer membrane protein TolC
MGMTRHRITLILLGTLAGGAQLAAQERSVTLPDALRLAERVQPQVILAQTDVRNATAQRRTAWGAYLPTVTATSSASDFFSEGASRVDPVTGQLTIGNSTNRSVSTSLAANVDLFTGLRRGADMRAARAGVNAAEASLIDARFQQALTTTNAFFDALAAQQLLAVREASVRRAEEQLKVSVNKLRAGSATRSDTLRSRVTLGTTQLDLLQAQTDLATTEAGARRGRFRFLPHRHRSGHGGHSRRGGSQVAPGAERLGHRSGFPGLAQLRALGLLAHAQLGGQHGVEREPAE